jgi:hypothetical protein
MERWAREASLMASLTPAGSSCSSPQNKHRIRFAIILRASSHWDFFAYFHDTTKPMRNTTATNADHSFLLGKKPEHALFSLLSA